MKKALIAILLVLGATQLPRAINFFHSIQNDLGKPLRFVPSKYPLKDRAFVILLVGRNNGAWIEPVLASISNQKYHSFRIIYIDDQSDDGSFSFVQSILNENKKNRVQIVQNPESVGFIPSMIQGILECDEEEIVVVLDDKKRLAHEWVLDRLNQYYDHPDLWAAYGKNLEMPSFKESSFEGSLMTFYAGCFKDVEDPVFAWAGDATPDQKQWMYHFGKELEEGHVHLIPEVLSLTED